MVRAKLNSVVMVFAVISVVSHLSGEGAVGSMTGAVAMMALMLDWVYDGLRKRE